ncbi:MAG: His/Gly/Thr/Pro-type tRNA ligase C-terminal domain-containing protein, partial [Pyrinomonadaceae bacterium]
SLVLARELRDEGIRVLLYPQVDKLGSQFFYANARKVAFVAIIGENEQRSGTVSVKDMRKGSQEPLPRESIVAIVKERLESETRAKEERRGRFEAALLEHLNKGESDEKT